MTNRSDEGTAVDGDGPAPQQADGGERPGEVEEVLPASEICEIASRHGFGADERIVRDSAEQARRYHGKPCGHSENGRDGSFDAEMLLDSYLAQEAQTGRCDSAAAADFEDAAYGSGWDD